VLGDATFTYDHGMHAMLRGFKETEAGANCAAFVKDHARDEGEDRKRFTVSVKKI
jgi:hypothetical protein